MIEIPENIEELIAAYLRQEAQRLNEHVPKGWKYISVSIGTLDLEPAKAHVGVNLLDEPDRPKSSMKTTVRGAVDDQIERLKHFDPASVTRTEIAKLQAKLAELEGGAK